MPEMAPNAPSKKHSRQHSQA